MSSSCQNLLDADPFGFARFQNTPERKVIVLWDYENCPIPKGVSGLSAIRNIREAALTFGSIDQFEAYCDWSNKANTAIKNDLSMSGVKLSDCPRKGWNDTVNKAIVVDMMVYALERPRTTTVLLISGDRDHAYAISTLRNRGYLVKLLAPTETLHSDLQVLADLLDWNSIFKSDLPPADLLDFSALAGGEEVETEAEEDPEETREDEDEDKGADGEKEEIETEETAPVQVRAEAEVDETAQVQVLVEAEVEETGQVQVESEEKAQVPVKTDEEMNSREPALPTPPNSEPVATSTPAGILPVRITAEPVLPSRAVLLEPLSALAQERLEERPRSPPVPSPSPPMLPPVVSPSNNGGGSSLHEPGESVLERPRGCVPAKFSLLVEELDTFKKDGIFEPTWSVICITVKARCPTILRDVGVKRWKGYMLLAEKDGIVRNTKDPSGREAARLLI